MGFKLANDPALLHSRNARVSSILLTLITPYMGGQIKLDNVGVKWNGKEIIELKMLSNQNQF